MSSWQDKYGRTVEMSSDGVVDTYIVSGTSGFHMELKFKGGTQRAEVMSAIEAMAPEGYVQPEPPADTP